MKTAIQWFERLTQIPRASGEEKLICDYLEQFAQERNLPFRRDALNNAIILKPATPGATAAAVILQAHTDIVPVKGEGVIHDFSIDPVEVIKEGDIWRANGTTLGADNGLGIAAILELLDDPDAVHPALECVFTAQEEVGLIGAAALDVSPLTARRMINLDCGGEGEFCTSCAGGIRLDIVKPVTRSGFVHAEGYDLEITGLKGGHSGGEIHKGRANALRLIARAMRRLSDECNARLCSLCGGGKDNVIPSYACASFLCENPPHATIAALKEEFRTEFIAAEPDLDLLLKPATVPAPLIPTDSNTVIQLMLTLPCGVRALIPGQTMVETSANLGSVSLEGDAFRLTASHRSSNDVAKQSLLDEARIICELTGAKMAASGDYPGWPYQPQSSLRTLIERVYHEHTGEQACFFGIHAGLECGLFISKIPGLDAVAMGSASSGAHTVKEQMSVSSLERTTAFLKKLVAELSREQTL